MVREIKASLVSHASLIQAMTPNLAAAHSNSGMPDLPSYSAPQSPSFMATLHTGSYVIGKMCPWEMLCAYILCGLALHAAS